MAIDGCVNKMMVSYFKEVELGLACFGNTYASLQALVVRKILRRAGMMSWWLNSSITLQMQHLQGLIESLSDRHRWFVRRRITHSNCLALECNQTCVQASRRKVQPRQYKPEPITFHPPIWIAGNKMWPAKQSYSHWGMHARDSLHTDQQHETTKLTRNLGRKRSTSAKTECERCACLIFVSNHCAFSLSLSLSLSLLIPTQRCQYCADYGYDRRETRFGAKHCQEAECMPSESSK